MAAGSIPVRVKSNRDSRLRDRVRVTGISTASHFASARSLGLEHRADSESPRPVLRLDFGFRIVECSPMPPSRTYGGCCPLPLGGGGDMPA